MTDRAAFRIRRPASPADFERYYALRWELLRAPWKQPRGSERDEYEETAVHLLAEHGDELIGVARLHSLSDTEGQIRYMGVRADWRGQGIGAALLRALEEQARARGLTTLVLHAREPVVGFYVRHGYEVIGPSHTLFGEIPHCFMRKVLAPSHPGEN